jgi:hypothetical protein
MLSRRGLFIGSCLLIATFAHFQSMFSRGVRLPFRQVRHVMQMSAIKATAPAAEAITLVDFRLPAHENEVIQNLVNDEIISSSIIGAAYSMFCGFYLHIQLSQSPIHFCRWYMQEILHLPAQARTSIHLTSTQLRIQAVFQSLE